MPSPTENKKRASRPAAGARWPLQDAKARFSELVRKAQAEGPQRVTIHGRDAFVVLSQVDYARLKGESSGQQLVELLAASPLKEVEFDHPEIRGPVRNVKL